MGQLKVRIKLLMKYGFILIISVFYFGGDLNSPKAQEVEKKDSLNFVLPSMYPYAWIGSGGELRGIFVDFANALFEDTYFDINIRVLSHSRFRRDINAEQRDLSVASTFVSPGDDSVILGPVFCSNISILPLLGTDIHSLEDLEGKTVSVVTGSRSTEILKENSKINVVEVANSFDNVRMLALERVEAIKASGITISRLFLGFSDIIRVTPENLETFGEPFEISPFKVNMTIDKSRVSSKDLDYLKQVMTDFQVSEKYKNVLENFGNPEELLCSG